MTKSDPTRKEPRRHPDGSPYSMDDYEKELAEAEELAAKQKDELDQLDRKKHREMWDLD